PLLGISRHAASRAHRSARPHVGARLHQCACPCKGRLRHHVGGALSFGDCDAARARRALGRPFRLSLQGGRVMRRLVLLAACLPLLAACGEETEEAQYGSTIELPDPRRGLLPDMTIPRPTAWEGTLPTVPEGYSI